MRKSKAKTDDAVRSNANVLLSGGRADRIIAEDAITSAIRVVEGYIQRLIVAAHTPGNPTIDEADLLRALRTDEKKYLHALVELEKAEQSAPQTTRRSRTPSTPPNE